MGVCLACIATQILLYADDTMLIPDSPEGLKWLGITFIGPRFSLWEDTCAQLSCGYGAIVPSKLRMYSASKLRVFKF